MRVGHGPNSYQWVDDWVKIPDTESSRMSWAHHGVAVTDSGDVVTFHPGDSTMVVLNRAGHPIRTWDLSVADAHGITLVKEGARECLWIADSGRKRQPQLGYEYPPSTGPFSGQVVKTTLDGEILFALSKPDLAIYREGNYSPTFVAVNEERHGGNGDIWVADGYGESYVHRYSKAGEYLSSINGEEGRAGRFATVLMGSSSTVARASPGSMSRTGPTNASRSTTLMGNSFGPLVRSSYQAPAAS